MRNLASRSRFRYSTGVSEKLVAPVAAKASGSEADSCQEAAPRKEKWIICGALVAIGLLFLCACFFEKALVDYYSAELIVDLAKLIPGALSRYAAWIAAATILFAGFYDKLLPGVCRMSFKKRLIHTTVFALLLNTLILTRTWQFPYCIDDAYIIFRYADNMLRFASPDFDVGTHVNTISSQLHFLLLVAVCFVTGQRDIPLVSQSINLAQEIASLFVLYALLKTVFQRSSLALYGCAIHVSSAYLILEVMRGKEGPAVTLLLYSLFYAIVAKRETLKAWVSALLCLARPEGCILVFVLLFSDVKNHLANPFRTLKSWLPPVSLVALVFLAIYLYYGTAMPQGILAKAAIYHAPALVCISFISAHLFSAFIGIPAYWGGLMGILALFMFYGLFVVVFWPYRFLRFYIVSLFFLTAFFGFGNALMDAFPWYLSWWAPLPPLFFVAVLKQLQDRQSSGYSSAAVQALLVSFSLIVIPLHSFRAPTAFNEVVTTLPVFYWDNIYDRLRIYEVARNHLNKYGKKSDTLAVVEVGVIGYRFEGKIFDLLGLVSPEALKLYPVPEEKRSHCGLSIPPQYARLYKPERMLFLDCFARNGLLADDYFNKHYQMDWFWKNDSFGSVGVYLYKRIDEK